MTSATVRTRGDRTPSARASRLLANTLTYTFLIAGAALMLGPFLFSLLTSLKTPSQFNTTWPVSLPDPITTENFTSLFSEEYNFVVPIAVTAQVVLVLVAGQMLCSILAAYAFAQLDFPGRDTLFWVYVATLMIPAVVTIIPLYSMMTSLDLKNTFLGLVLPFMFGSPYAIFLLRENFRSTPADVLDAATIDGAGVWRRLWQIMVPMNTPILATLLLITVVTQWNNFLWPLIIAPAQEWNVITVATAALQTQYAGNWTLVMAATTIAIAPLVTLFIIFQKQITSSLGVTGVR
ncbi:carbohydrate ABC transporter permease [Ruania alba]|uniref:Carbohydrate ABC transporter membrane protein 2, CUT1 family n=1 Tax=Ruania alba TaxID=648782 RepID=A0A1H5M370_9MICO|nr:carbohydrate ABC transporter permease [Ruania alba]SEE83653.1 carbohydrate ABC transporter membrane protein 2, CUT1 family [Ruania alba]